MKYKEKKKLVKYLNHLNDLNVKYPDGYLEYHKNKIEWIKWLIHSYEGLAGDPKELLEAMIKFPLNHYNDYVEECKKFNIEPLSEVDKLKNLIKDIDFIYHWVYYKKITGF